MGSLPRWSSARLWAACSCSEPSRSLRAATGAIGVNAIAFTAIVYGGTLYRQDELGYNPSRAGLALVPINLTGIAVSLLGARILAGRSTRRVLLASFAADVVALVWLARTPDPARYVVDVMLPLTVMGVSLCLTFIVATQQAVADVSADEKGLASGSSSRPTTCSAGRWASRSTPR